MGITNMENFDKIVNTLRDFENLDEGVLSKTLGELETYHQSINNGVAELEKTNEKLVQDKQSLIESNGSLLSGLQTYTRGKDKEEQQRNEDINRSLTINDL